MNEIGAKEKFMKKSDKSIPKKSFSISLEKYFG